jgi:hypothetical protein
VEVSVTRLNEILSNLTREPKKTYLESISSLYMDFKDMGGCL